MVKSDMAQAVELSSRALNTEAGNYLLRAKSQAVKIILELMRRRCWNERVNAKASWE